MVVVSHVIYLCHVIYHVTPLCGYIIYSITLASVACYQCGEWLKTKTLSFLSFGSKQCRYGSQCVYALQVELNREHFINI